MDDSSQVGEARRFALLICGYLDFDEVRTAKVSIIVNELGNNLVRYAQKGKLLFRILDFENKSGFEIISIDSGPGFVSTEQVLADGFSTGSTPGTGLGAIKRQADLFDIFSVPGKGTVILAQIQREPKNKNEKYRIGAISIPLSGESVCGDAWVCKIDQEDIKALVVDGLGHGPQANRAADEAVNTFNEKSQMPLDQLLVNIHGRLKSTRGGAVFLVESKLGNEVFFLGVGNIRALVYDGQRGRTLISQNGTAGLQMRTPRVLNQEWPLKSILILHSDGIHSRWDFSEYPGILNYHPSIVSAVIYRDFLRGNDDATVLVISRGQ